MTLRDALTLNIIAAALLTFGFWNLERHFTQQDTINQETLAWTR